MSPAFSGRAGEALDPNSEMIALSTRGNTKNLIITAVEVRGALDVEALRSAVNAAVEDYPHLRCSLKEDRRNGRRRLIREPRPDLDVPIFVWDAPPNAEGMSGLDAFLDRIGPRIDRDWDLFNELPVETHVMKVSDDRYVIAPVLHHAAADAVVASEFGRRVVLEYDRIKTVISTEIPVRDHGMSASRKRSVPVKRRTFKDVAKTVREAILPFKEKPSFPVGEGAPDDARQFHIKRMFTEEETAVVGKLALERRISLIDLLSASSNLAVEQWNERKGKGAGVITTSMTVNMRGRYEGVDGANNASVIFFKTDPDLRRDRNELLRQMSLARMRHFRAQTDLKTARNIKRMTDALALLPYGLRSRLVHTVLEKHAFSIGVTLLGVVWPVFENGKPTGQSWPTTMGNVEIAEIHGVGYKLLSGTKLVLIVYIYRNRINFVTATAASLFTRDEGEAFMDLFMDILRDSVRQCAG